APYDDRSAVTLSITAPEGASFDYTDRFILNMAQLVNDSIPEKLINLSVTAPGFSGSGSANTGFMRLRFVEPGERERSQKEIAEKLGQDARQFSEARAFVIQQPTIAVNRRGGLPIQY